MSWSVFNSVLAFVIFLCAIHSIGKMNGTTRHCIRAGVLLILVGSLGQWLGAAVERWDPYLDTLFYAGVLVLIVFNSRYRRTEAK